MPLEDPQVIDVVRKTEDGKIVLVITDAGTISDPKERVACLIQKLKIYINSIVSGDLKRDYPEHTPKDYTIEVACSLRPTEEMSNISRVMPRKDPASAVSVHFVEFPTGAWGPSHPELFGHIDSGRLGKPGELGEPLDSISVAALERGVELAEPYLAEGEKGFYFAVLGWDGCKTGAVHFRENSVTAEVMKEVDQYVRNLNPDFKVCVVVSVEKLKYYNRGNKEAVVLVLYRRGWKVARVYSRLVHWKGGFLRYQDGSQLEMIGTKVGLFPG